MSGTVVSILLTALGMLVGLLVGAVTFGRRVGAHEATAKATQDSLSAAVMKLEASAERLSSIPQIEKDITALSSRFGRHIDDDAEWKGRMRSDFGGLRERVSVMNERKASKDGIAALRVPTNPEWNPKGER